LLRFGAKQCIFLCYLSFKPDGQEKTDVLSALLFEYLGLDDVVTHAQHAIKTCDNPAVRPNRRGKSMKVSARNVLEGKIVEVHKGTTTAHVTIDVKGLRITASITNEAVDDLGLRAGGTAMAVIKASDVLVAVN
jgi:molybdopterin-binding protein